MINVLFWAFVLLALFLGFLIFAANWLTRHYTSLYDLKLIGQPRTDKDKGNTAVVLGGGLAGILSARVLFDHYKNVIIIEHDDYSDPDRVRPSVQQGAHAHIVLAIANICLRTLFPTIETELKRRGAHVSDLGKAMKWFYWGSWRVRPELDLPFWCCTRPFLDTLIRDIFLHFYGDKITFLTRRQIMSPVLSTDLQTLGITQHQLRKAIDGVQITGDYTHIGTNIPDDEFRVVGVRVKKRPQKSTPANSEAANAAPQGPICDLEDIANLEANKADLGKLTTTLTVQTVVRNAKPVHEISVNAELNTAIRYREDDWDEEYILGDIIVDCTGGSSILSKWCERLWKVDIPTSQLKASSMYVSHLFHEPDNFEDEMKKHGDGKPFVCLPIYPTPGRSSYFGYLMRVENKQWQVTAMGTAGHHVPNTNLPEFIHHLRRLDHELIHKFVSQAQPVANESLFTYHPKVYQSRHWDRIKHRPDGIVVVGNSSTIFDPMYGQGMSGACIAALALNATLKQDKYATAESLSSYALCQSYFHILKDRMYFPWMLCIVEDSRWKEIELNKEATEIKESFQGTWLKYWIRQGMVLARTEPLAQQIAMGIMNMTCSFTELLYPRIVFKVACNVFAETFGNPQTPERLFDEVVLPAKLQREKWEISPILTKEREQQGLVYDYLIPQLPDKKND